MVAWAMSLVVGLRILLCRVLGLDGRILRVHGDRDVPKFRRNQHFQCPVLPFAFQDPSVSVQSPRPLLPHPLLPLHHPLLHHPLPPPHPPPHLVPLPPPNPAPLQPSASPPQTPTPHPPLAQQTHASSTSPTSSPSPPST